MTITAPTDTREALLSWAGRDDRYSLEDVRAILQAHGLTLGDWLTDCEARSWQHRTQDAQALLTWLGY